MSYELLAIGAALTLIYAAISTYVGASLCRKMDEQAELEKEWRKKHYNVTQCERESVAHWKDEADLRGKQIEQLQAEGRSLIARLEEEAKEAVRLRSCLIDLDAENKKLMSRIMTADTHAAEARRALAGAKPRDAILDLVNEPQEKLSC